MSKNVISRAAMVVATTSLALAATSAMAQNAPRTNVRGTVISQNSSTLKIKSRDGKIVEVALADGWKIASVARASLTSIKPGDYVGIASMPNAKGDRALEVLILPPAMKGLGEGSHGYDLKPKSSMTNASVTNLVKGVRGQMVTLSYNGGQQKTITIPPSAPVVTLSSATPADLKLGAAVFIPAEGAAGGKLMAHQVIVGKNGVVPPM
jgi:hypothetical protein